MAKKKLKEDKNPKETLKGRGRVYKHNPIPIEEIVDEHGAFRGTLVNEIHVLPTSEHEIAKTLRDVMDRYNKDSLKNMWDALQKGSKETTKPEKKKPEPAQKRPTNNEREKTTSENVDLFEVMSSNLNWIREDTESIVSMMMDMGKRFGKGLADPKEAPVLVDKRSDLEKLSDNFTSWKLGIKKSLKGGDDLERHEKAVREKQIVKPEPLPVPPKSTESTDSAADAVDAEKEEIAENTLNVTKEQSKSIGKMKDHLSSITKMTSLSYDQLVSINGTVKAIKEDTGLMLSVKNSLDKDSGSEVKIETKPISKVEKEVPKPPATSPNPLLDLGEEAAEWFGKRMFKKMFGKKVAKEGAEVLAKKGTEEVAEKVAVKGAEKVATTTGKEVAEKVAVTGTEKIGQKIATTTGKEIAEKVAIKGGAEVAEKAVAKGLVKTIGKRIPGLGLLVGAGFAVNELMNGDIVGAGMEMASGAASLLDIVAPGAGLATGLAIDAAHVAKDVGAFDSPPTPESQPPLNIDKQDISKVPPPEKPKESVKTQALNEFQNSQTMESAKTSATNEQMKNKMIIEAAMSGQNSQTPVIIPPSNAPQENKSMGLPPITSGDTSWLSMMYKATYG